MNRKEGVMLFEAVKDKVDNDEVAVIHWEGVYKTLPCAIGALNCYVKANYGDTYRIATQNGKCIAALTTKYKSMNRGHEASLTFKSKQWIKSHDIQYNPILFPFEELGFKTAQSAYVTLRHYCSEYDTHIDTAKNQVLIGKRKHEVFVDGLLDIMAIEYLCKTTFRFFDEENNELPSMRSDYKKYYRYKINHIDINTDEHVVKIFLKGYRK